MASSSTSSLPPCYGSVGTAGGHRRSSPANLTGFVLVISRSHVMVGPNRRSRVDGGRRQAGPPTAYSASSARFVVVKTSDRQDQYGGSGLKDDGDPPDDQGGMADGFCRVCRKVEPQSRRRGGPSDAIVNLTVCVPQGIPCGTAAIRLTTALDRLAAVAFEVGIRQRAVVTPEIGLHRWREWAPADNAVLQSGNPLIADTTDVGGSSHDPAGEDHNIAMTCLRQTDGAENTMPT